MFDNARPDRPRKRDPRRSRRFASQAQPGRAVENLEARRLLAVAINEFGGSAALQNTAGITRGPDGNLWFTEANPLGGAISRITPSGSINRYTVGLSPFAIPTGITTGPDGALWFTEYGAGSLGSPTGASAIGRLDPNTGQITEYTANLTPNSGPDLITLGPDGNLWFTENKGNKIGRINPTTFVITEFAIPTPNSEPAGIVAGPDGALWFTQSNTDQIGRIDPNTGQVTEFGQVPGLPRITPDGAPTGITLGPDGNLWFTELNSATVGKITTQGIVTQYTAGITPGAGPAGITSGPDGNLYFTEQVAGRVARITTQGVVTELTQGYSPVAGPADITLGPDGNLWFTELQGTHVDRISPLGAYAQFPAATTIPSNNPVLGIATGSDGALWFTEQSDVGGAIGRMNTSGIISQFTQGLTSGSSPFSITAGPDGNLWFTDQGRNAIGRITTQGVITEFPIPPLNPSSPIASPQSITSGPDGNLWFTASGDTQGSFIGRITPQGAITQFSIGLPGSSFDSRNTGGITTGPDGNLWFTNYTLVFGPMNVEISAVGKITTQGVITQYTLADPTAQPTDIATGPDGALYFTETGVGRIGRVTTAGVLSEIPSGPLLAPQGIVLGPDRRLYFLEKNSNYPNGPGGNSVDRLDPDGSITKVPVPTPEAAPFAMTVGSDGNLYFTEAAVFFQDSVHVPVSQIGQVILPQASAVARPVPQVNVTEGQSFTAVLGSFVDRSPAALPINFDATINFGDGVIANAPVSSDGKGGFLVVGTHTYINPGTYNGVVTILNPEGQATLTFRAVVNRVALSFVVTNTNDAGRGSLRQAILNSNQVGGRPITFAIPGTPGSVRTIALRTPLPIITSPTGLNGRSQGEFDGVATLTPLVEVDGRGISTRSQGLVFGPSTESSALLDLSIFGFQSSQVVIDSPGVVVYGNYIGFPADPAKQATFIASAGSAPDPGSDGLLIRGLGVTVGGLSPGQRNVISGNLGQGVEFAGAGSSGSIVEGNYIGTDPTGTIAVPNRINGVVIGGGAGRQRIGPANLISGNAGIGVELLGASGVLIAGNFIGVDISGIRALGNGVTGICVDGGSSGNLIGSTMANVISGNGQIGLAIQGGSSRNSASFNRIGTDPAGTIAIGNGIAGILVSESPFNVIGPGNVVSGNGTASQGAGIWVEGVASTGVYVTGNMVGTDPTGQFALANSIIGILINESASNVIGLGPFGGGNLVSGNTQIGVMLSGIGANRNLVQGNLIGTNLGGTARLGNGTRTEGAGVYLLDAPGNTIGGASPGLANLISGNGYDGINAFGPGTTGNRIEGNKIGTDLAGSGPLGNGNDGVVLIQAPRNSILGNVIASNALNGITISGVGAVGNVLANNRIGVGVGGEPLGNGAFGILIVNQARGTVVGPNLNANNGTGPIRDTNITPATPSRTASVASKKAARKKPVKVQHAKAKPKGPRSPQPKARVNASQGNVRLKK